MIEDKGFYARAHKAFEEKFMPAHKGVTFNRERVYNFLGIRNTKEHIPLKEAIGQVLYKLSDKNKDIKNPTLEQVSRDSYRIIERELRKINWLEGDGQPVIPIRWFYGVDDATEFGFEDSIVIHPKDVIGIAGEGNRGKTCLAMNFMLNNLDLFPSSTYFISENEHLFRDRMSKFDWISYKNENGKPKFELVKLEENFQDGIQPEGQNIFDWVDMPDEPWKIGQIFKKASDKLTTGIAFICMQKRSYKKFAVGGESAMDYASAFFTIAYDQDISSNVLKVEKVKIPGTVNPNYRKYRFAIQNGAKLFAIEELH